MDYLLLNSAVEIYLDLLNIYVNSMFLSSLHKTCKIGNRKLILSCFTKRLTKAFVEI